MADNHQKNHPINKVKISGPTLSSLLHHLTSTTTTTSGLLFGDFSLLTPSPLSDDDPTTTTTTSPPPSSTTLIASISGFSPTTTTVSHHRRSSSSSVIGLFSARLRCPLRPSLLDHSLSLSHSSTTTSPFIFLLLTTTPTTPTLIHTHDYRAYQFRHDTASFEAVSLEVVNIGPGFRGQYGLFSPKSGLPLMACVSHLGSPMREDPTGVRSLSELKKVGIDQKELDVYVSGGYDVGSLTRLVGSDAFGYMSGVEDLYEKMLAKLHGLAHVVETSSARVLELEHHNMKLRRRVAGIE